MDVLIKAIKVRYTAQATFATALTGGIHLAEMSKEFTAPYCCLVVSESPFWTFDNNFERYTVTFTLVSDTRDASEIIDLYEKLKACFDEAPLSVTGYHLIRFWRVNSSSIDRIDDGWQITVEYACELEET